MGGTPTPPLSPVQRSYLRAFEAWFNDPEDDMRIARVNAAFSRMMRVAGLVQLRDTFYNARGDIRTVRHEPRSDRWIRDAPHQVLGIPRAR